MAVLEYATGGSIAISRARSWKALSKTSLLVAATLLVLFYRRPDQFLHPYIWVEDGTEILKAFAETGAWSLFKPVSGYHVLATKLVTLSAYKISFLWAPEIAVAPTVAFTCGVIASVALAPTHLRWRPLCALLPVLIPTDSEVFAVSEYTFWWAGLWIILALIWDRNRGWQALRLFFIVFGGLSSPIVIPLSCFFGLRAAMERHRSEVTCAGVAALLAAVQAGTLHVYGGPTATLGKLTIPLFVEKFFGLFVGAWISSEDVTIAVGWAVISLIAASIFLERHKIDRYFVFIGLSWLSITVIVLLRIPLKAIHPFVDGPRYFFYSYILLGWAVTWLAAKSNLSMRSLLLAVLAVGIAQGLPKLTRRHDAVDWRQHVALCAQSEEYDLPIHYDGNASKMWKVHLQGAQCRALIDGSLF